MSEEEIIEILRTRLSLEVDTERGECFDGEIRTTKIIHLMLDGVSISSVYL